jgi:hypothetical protein
VCLGLDVANLIIFILLKSEKKIIPKNLKKVLLFHFQKTNLQFAKIPRKKNTSVARLVFSCGKQENCPFYGKK